MARKINAKNRWIYNGSDCIATIGAFNVLNKLPDELQRTLYRAEIALEASTLAIQSRGILVDLKVRKQVLKELEAEFIAKEHQIHGIAQYEVNPNSHEQVHELFYVNLKLKPMRNKDGKISVDRSVLERIANGNVELSEPVPRGTKDAHLNKCASLANLVMEARSIVKDKGMVKSPLDNGRIRSSINVGATESFRFSASGTNFNRGANLQQVRGVIRRMMIADLDMTLVYADQDRAESTVVAHLSGDENYVNAHRAQDTHVEVAKLIWPAEPWTGNDVEDDKFAREPNFIRHYSRRDMSKRTQHALNYYPPGPLRLYKLKGKGPHHTLSRMLKITKRTAYEITNLYFEAFPGIGEWQAEISEIAKLERRVFYPGGFYRDLFGKRNDAATHREAISSIPQFVVAWTNHAVMTRLWQEYDKLGKFEMLMHTHDAVLFQVDDWARWEEPFNKAVDIPWPKPGGTFTIPWSYKTGQNWMEASDE